MQKQNSKQKGDLAEDIASSYLEDNGYKIVQKNFYAKKLGEIDIIATKDEIYHFCEVKSSSSYQSAVNNILGKKLYRLKRSVEYYIQSKKLDCSYCIDAIIVIDNEVEFLENITM